MYHHKHGIPKWADRFLAWFCAPEFLEEVQGDLYESYERNVARFGEKRARRKFLWELCCFFTYSTIRGEKPLRFHLIQFTMFRNYLKTTLRLFAKNKVYLLINTLGLGIALACCMVAYLFFAYNLEFDECYSKEKVAKTFKVHAHEITKAGDEMESMAAPLPLAPAAFSDIAGIDRYTRFVAESGFVQKDEIGFRERIAFADSTFFEMFDFPLRHGNREHFKDKYSVYLSRNLAKKLGWESDPTGERLKLNFQNEREILVTVGGVLERMPENNSFLFDAVVRFEQFLDIKDLAADDWSDYRNPATFFEVASLANVPAINDQLDHYLALRNEAKSDRTVHAYKLEHFNAYFEDDEVFGNYLNTRMQASVRILFGILAGMILLIACFNLTNTSIAMSSRRLKEIGIRKAVGAARRQIAGQFISETMIIMAISLLAGLAIAVWGLLPEFTSMFSFDYGIRDLSGFKLFIAMVMMMITASVLAGIYPALFNSRLNPVALVKGTFKVKGTNWLTRIFTGSQFALSVIFLLAGILFFQNIRFQERLELGYNKDQLMVVPVPGEKAFNLLKSEVHNHAKIIDISGTASHLSDNSFQTSVEFNHQTYNSRAMRIGEGYLNTVGLNVFEGVDLAESNNFDPGTHVIVNRAFLEMIDLERPLGNIIFEGDQKRQIVGVVDNHIDDLQRSKEQEPFIFYLAEPQQYNLMVIKAAESDLAGVYKDLEKTWRSLFPHLPFDGQLQDDVVLKDLRLANINLTKIFLFLTILGTVMSIAGIFSIASLNITRRTKEIGVRKVLGASRSSIVVLMNREFVIILAIAVVLGSVGGLFLTDLLLSFLYNHHIAVSAFSVILSGLTLFAAGYLTTSGSILKAARANPVDALRSE